MRHFVVAALVVAFISTAQPAVALPSVRLVWTGTSGAGLVGGSSTTAEPGDILTLDVLVDIDMTGFSAASVSLSWDAGDLVGNNALECPSPPSLLEGICFSVTFKSFTPIVPGVVIGADTASSFDAAGPAAEFEPSELTLGRIQFVVGDSATQEVISTFGVEGIDGVADGSVMFMPVNVATADIDVSRGMMPNGAACGDPDDCESGFCIDGVCCDTICDGGGRLCDLPGHLGVCMLACACADVAAPSPTTSWIGLLLGVGALTAVAGAALFRRQSLPRSET